jgi:hypothetical protein
MDLSSAPNVAKIGICAIKQRKTNNIVKIA